MQHRPLNIPSPPTWGCCILQHRLRHEENVLFVARLSVEPSLLEVALSDGLGLPSEHRSAVASDLGGKGLVASPIPPLMLLIDHLGDSQVDKFGCALERTVVPNVFRRLSTHSGRGDSSRRGKVRVAMAHLQRVLLNPPPSSWRSEGGGLRCRTVAEHTRFRVGRLGVSVTPAQNRSAAALLPKRRASTSTSMRRVRCCPTPSGSAP